MSTHPTRSFLLSDPVDLSLSFITQANRGRIGEAHSFYKTTISLNNDIDLILETVDPGNLSIIQRILHLGLPDSLRFIADITDLSTIVAVKWLRHYLHQSRNIRAIPYCVMLAIPGPHTPETAWAVLDPVLGTHPRPPLITYDPHDPDRVRRALQQNPY